MPGLQCFVRQQRPVQRDQQQHEQLQQPKQQQRHQQQLRSAVAFTSSRPVVAQPDARPRKSTSALTFTILFIFKNSFVGMQLQAHYFPIRPKLQRKQAFLFIPVCLRRQGLPNCTPDISDFGRLHVDQSREVHGVTWTFIFEHDQRQIVGLIHRITAVWRHAVRQHPAVAAIDFGPGMAISECLVLCVQQHDAENNPRWQAGRTRQRVVVRGHSAHPGISDLISQAFDTAIKECGMHPGVFSQIQGGDFSVGQALVKHPLIRAVGFTGSLAGGRALYDMCAARDEPIPFYGELGSVNPMFLLPEAVSARCDSIATGWAGSLTMGAGQFCTNPGIAIMIGGPDTDAFVSVVTDALSKVDSQTMLTEGIAAAFSDGQRRIKSSTGVRELLSTSCDSRHAAPYLYQTTGKEWLANKSLGEEVFGPLGMIVVVDDSDEMLAVANALQGQLTCTLHLDDADTELARKLMPVLERKAGRILANGFPTGVEVCDSMVHGGPYPASTNFGATSVGTMAIRRFLRPVSYQNIPPAILPEDLA